VLVANVSMSMLSSFSIFVVSFALTDLQIDIRHVCFGCE